MDVRLLHSETRVEPQFPLELVALAGSDVLRVEIEWATLERLLGPGRLDEEVIRDFVHRNRHAIEIAVAAHLFAQGVPLSRQLVLSREDLARLSAEHANS